MGQLLEELMDLAKTNGISLPAGLSMLGRGVMTIEGVITPPAVPKSASFKLS